MEQPESRAERLIPLVHGMYALHALSVLTGMLTPAFVVTAFLTGWPSIIAILVNYIKRGDARGTWLESHFRWQARTFWFALLWLAVAGILMITVVLIPVAWALLVVVGIWVLYRLIRGWLNLVDRNAVASYTQ